mmetsp:Transcript_22040/g.75563  ORF Transcript_22040/g.75563 Transcript_22040/m.75563 type:complete len:166 (+) Transcript_22040:107-604(+)
MDHQKCMRGGAQGMEVGGAAGSDYKQYMDESKCMQSGAQCYKQCKDDQKDNKSGALGGALAVTTCSDNKTGDGVDDVSYGKEANEENRSNEPSGLEAWVVPDMVLYSWCTSVDSFWVVAPANYHNCRGIVVVPRKAFVCAGLVYGCGGAPTIGEVPRGTRLEEQT